MLAKTMFLVSLVLAACVARPEPDSAGVVPLPPGLAYGGIPYGSVTGMLAKYQPPANQHGSQPHAGDSDFNLL